MGTILARSGPWTPDPVHSRLIDYSGSAIFDAEVISKKCLFLNQHRERLFETDSITHFATLSPQLSFWDNCPSAKKNWYMVKDQGSTEQTLPLDPPFT